jgi:hypothetical protein
VAAQFLGDRLHLPRRYSLHVHLRQPKLRIVVRSPTALASMGPAATPKRRPGHANKTFDHHCRPQRSGPFDVERQILNDCGIRAQMGQKLSECKTIVLAGRLLVSHLKRPLDWLRSRISHGRHKLGSSVAHCVARGRACSRLPWRLLLVL